MIRGLPNVSAIRNSKSTLFAVPIGLTMLTLALAGCTAQTSQTFDVGALAADTSGFQATILSDNSVTSAEYEKSALAYRECVIVAGGQASELSDGPGKTLIFEWSVTADTTGQVEAINAKADRCLPEYFDAVSTVWSYQNLLLPEAKEKLRPKVIECLRADGVDLSDDADFNAILGSIAKAREDKPMAGSSCIAENIEFFQVAPSNGKKAQ